MNSKTTAFIEKAKKIHHDKYDYSQIQYINCLEKIKIVCNLHGVFLKTPRKFLTGSGCPICAFKNAFRKTKTTLQFIKESILIHGNKYDYSNVVYINNKTKVKIICKNHGEFLQSPVHHIRGAGCPKCVNCLPLTHSEFIKRAKLTHGNKYDYSFSNYESLNKKISIKCKTHGFFTQQPANHFNGAGCPACAGCKKDNKDDFVEKSILIHGNKYDYSNVVYINNKTKVKIICKNHGEFLQSPVHHKNGSGCQKCKSSTGERIIRNFLIKKSEHFTEQAKFSTCKNKKELSFDFYIEHKNILIEFQGEHHYPPKNKTRMFGAKNVYSAYNKVKINDQIKQDWCVLNNKNLILIDYRNIDEIEEILTYMIYNGQ